MLKFLGTGSAFHTQRGNNSAWMICGRDLFIFDMGGDVLPKMVQRNVFDGISRVHIFITHMHGDHVGGLAATVMYVFSEVLHHRRKDICVYFPDPELEKFLRMQGVEQEIWYCLRTERKGEIIPADNAGEKVTYSFEQTRHSPSLGAHVYGIDLQIGAQKRIFYSGDSSIFNPNCLHIDDYAAVYHEITSDAASQEHFRYEELLRLTAGFTPEQKKKIHLMHIPKEFDCHRALADGFCVVNSAQTGGEP